MKKWVFAAAALVVCGWASATWVHAERTESNYRVSLEAFGERHGLQLVEISYERTFLNSVAHTAVQGGMAVSAYADIVPADWQQDSQLVLEHVIQHGPLILGDGVEPLAARVVTTLDMDSLNSEAAAGMRELCGCEEPIRVVSEIAHDGGMSHDWRVSSLLWNGELEGSTVETKIAASDGVLASTADGRVSADGKIGLMSMRSEQANLVLDPIEWRYSGVVSDIAGLGEMVAESRGLRVTGEKGELALTALSASNVLSDRNGTLHGTSKVGFKSMRGPVSLGETALTATAGGIPMSSMKHYTQEISAQDFSTVVGREAFLRAYFALFQPGASVALKLDSETAAGHAVSASKTVTYAHNKGPLNTVGDLLSRVTASLDIEVADAFLTDLGLDHLAGALTQFARADGEQYSLTLSLANGAANLNGDPLPLAQMFAPVFAQPLPSLNSIATQWMALEQI